MELLCFTPFERPDVRLALAASRAGGLGIVSLGYRADRATAALASLENGVNVGVAFAEGCPPAVHNLSIPEAVSTIVLPPALFELRAGFKQRCLALAASVDEVARAHALGFDGIVLCGNEASGRVGDDSGFVLLQRSVRISERPLYLRGGIGVHVAAAAMGGGLVGVALDCELSLMREAGTPAELREKLVRLDGSEPSVIAGHRIFVPRTHEAVSEHTSSSALVELMASDDAILPLGQGIAFAAQLAERFGTMRNLVAGMRRAARAQRRQAALLEPLAPSSPWAEAVGVRYPIAQGPMTRVSDRPEFAAAVADAGGVPFIALSLLRSADARVLLEQTAKLIGARPWGVGILGFVPPELRDEQVLLLREIRPPLVIIAGGRPSQAAALEREGIRCYLHVPSPTLRDSFIKSGARRFVFEGRECGGHVGPLGSFPLWESAVARLCAHPKAHELDVLFAGGIHDGLSARIVSVLSAPLAARGARIAVSMGTAYLFTEEAVSSGALVAEFQGAALACTDTVLLRSAPGHATRVARTAVVDAFDEEALRLEREQVAAKERWAALEAFNLGRLRIASKGIERTDTGLRPLDRAAQRARGLYMMGQVACLRDRSLSMAALHAEVSEGSRIAAQVTARVSGDTDSANDGIAIVGLACILPGAPDAATYWANLVAGRDCITDVPTDRMDPARYYAPDGGRDKTRSKWGGFIPEVEFDPREFGIPPRSLSSIDPAQLLSLLVVKAALADAKLDDASLDRERTAVVFAADSGADIVGAHSFRAFFPQLVGELPEALAAHLPDLNEDSFPGALANVIPGRIANRFDFGGPNYAVNAACASSLAALDAACKELRSGHCDVAVAGAVDLHNSPYDYLMFESAGALSPSGRCRTFDGRADGIVLSEGVAALVLKRAEDARRDGDRVYAVVRGIAGSSDGRCKGLTAPRKEGQQRAVRAAYERAGVCPTNVQLFEAHGTGTVVGDKTELASLSDVLYESGAVAGQANIGSVKSSIGHTKCAAGLAGVIKAALATHYGIQPPTLHVEAPIDGCDAEHSPLFLRRRAAPWLEAQRYAGVSAFGFGGTNFHLILEGESARSIPVVQQPWPYELLVVRGEDAAARELAVEALQWLVERPSASLLSLASWLASREPDALVAHAVVVADLTDARRELEAIAAGRATAALRSRRSAEEIAFVFPGQGSQRVHMGADLALAFPSVRRWLERSPELAAILYPGAAFTPGELQAQVERLKRTEHAQPALGLVSLAMLELLEAVGVRAHRVAGHSFGEVTALCASGALPAERIVELAKARAHAILEAVGDDPGAMAAVRASRAEVQAHLSKFPEVVIANDNGPRQVVIAGATEAVAKAVKGLNDAGLKTQPIPVACAFHSPLLSGADDAFGAALARFAVRAPAIEVWSNTTASPHADDPASIVDQLGQQLVQPVEFAEQIDRMYRAAARVFVEVGPGAVLGQLIADILGDREHVVVSMAGDDQHGLCAWLQGLAKLALAGVPVDVERLFDGRQPAPLPARSEGPIWLVNGHYARPREGELEPGAYKPAAAPVAIGTAPLKGAVREETVLQYLRGMQEAIEGQRQVMMSYLGAPVAVPSHERASIASNTRASRDASSEDRREPIAATAGDPLASLVRLLAERTGFPESMLEPHLDLEADLGIDSIKRTEVIGLVLAQLGIEEQLSDEAKEELAAAKTLQELAALLRDRRDGGRSETTAVSRLVPRTSAAPPAPELAASHGGQRYALVGGPEAIVLELSRVLRQSGAVVTVPEPESQLDSSIDTWLELSGLESAGDPAKRVFSSIKRVLSADDSARIVAVTALGGRFGYGGTMPEQRSGVGIGGLIRSIRHELPSADIRRVDLDPALPAPRLVEQLMQELGSGQRSAEVGRVDQGRFVIEHVPAPRVAQSALRIDASSVVVLSGGGRGITAQVALELARRFRCTLVLLGRTDFRPLEGEEALEAADLKSLRRELASQISDIAALDARARDVLARREIRATLRGIAELGGRAEYVQVDVRDRGAMDQLRLALSKHAAIDVLIHGAGVIEDRLLKDKSQDSFDRVYDTKVQGARALIEAVGSSVRKVAFFSSVAAVYGNAGQSDYAAANDVLDKLAHELDRSRPGTAVSVNWGPWRSTGMVTEELERKYAAAGVGLIEPRVGAIELVDELIHGTEPQVILCAVARGEVADA